jgi:uncharacterized protein (TIGR03790 family)
MHGLRSITLSLLLVACGGGGGGGGASSTPPPDTGPNTNLLLTLPSNGLQPAQLAIIVAEGDPVSEAMGLAYQAARGVPAANLIRVPVNTGNAVISAEAFAALRASVESRLPAGVQATLLAWSAPSRVRGASCSMGITSAMAFGYQPGYCDSVCIQTAESPLYDSESLRPQADLGLRPSMLLARSSQASAQALIARGVAAEASRPEGTGYLLRTSDARRSVRYPDFAALPALWTDSLALRYLDNSEGNGSDALRDVDEVLFYFTGLSQVPDLDRVAFRPGALADTLTSFGGQLPDGNGQMPISAWLDAGASASYGTVEEPCNFTEKFPKASVLIDHYWRGATAIEAYWKSVQWPGQGLFVGDPLARPFAEASLLSIENGAYRLRSRTLRPGARYLLEYRTASNANWVELASFTGQRGQLLDATAPLAPGAAAQLRWRGPCPNDSAERCVLASSP